MGSAASKAPKRAFPKTQISQRTEPPGQQTSGQELPSTAGRPDQSQHRPTDQHQQDEVEQDFLKQLKQEGVKDAELGSFLDKLGGAIAGTRVSTLDIKPGTAKQPVHQWKEAGRLDTAAMQRLFQDVHRMEQGQKQVDLEALSQRYGIDISLLDRVIHFNRVPAVTQQPDGSLFGSWQWKS